MVGEFHRFFTSSSICIFTPSNLSQIKNDKRMVFALGRSFGFLGMDKVMRPHHRLRRSPAPEGGGHFYLYPKYSCISADRKSSCFSRSRRSTDFCPPLGEYTTRCLPVVIRRSTDFCPPPWGRGTAKRWWGNSTVSYCKSIIAILLSFIVVYRRSMTISIFSLPLCLLCNHGFLEGIVIRSAAFLCCPSASSPLCFSFRPYICASRKILTNFFEKK